MTDDQWECALLIRDLFHGFHHVNNNFKRYGDSGIQLNTTYGSWASYDYDYLTVAIVLCHDRMIRLEIKPSGPGMLKLCLWKRHVREGKMNEKHPTMEDAVSSIRKKLARDV